MSHTWWCWTARVRPVQLRGLLAGLRTVNKAASPHGASTMAYNMKHARTPEQRYKTLMPSPGLCFTCFCGRVGASRASPCCSADPADVRPRLGSGHLGEMLRSALMDTGVPTQPVYMNFLIQKAGVRLLPLFPLKSVLFPVFKMLKSTCKAERTQTDSKPWSHKRLMFAILDVNFIKLI